MVGDWSPLQDIERSGISHTDSCAATRPPPAAPDVRRKQQIRIFARSENRAIGATCCPLRILTRGPAGGLTQGAITQHVRSKKDVLLLVCDRVTAQDISPKTSRPR